MAEKQKNNSVRTGKAVASTASKILTDKRYSDAAKSTAGSALSNRKESTKKPK